MDVTVKKEKALGEHTEPLRSLAEEHGPRCTATRAVIRKAAGTLTHPKTGTGHSPFYIIEFYADGKLPLDTLLVIFHQDGTREVFRKPQRQTA